MKIRSFSALFVSALMVITLFGSCATTTTVTVTGKTITVPGSTVTLPAVTTTQPAVTVTLPGGVTTIPAATITIPAIVTTVPSVTISAPPITPGGFLPTKPSDITSHGSLMGDLAGDCLVCHGPALYNQFPMAPSWDGSDFGSQSHVGFYYVVSGSIQDHTGRTSAVCLTCHKVVS
jgi:hypothetical protein